MTAASPEATAAQATDLPEQAAGEVVRPALSMEDLHELIGAYNGLTEKLQHSHEALQDEVKRLRAELASTNEQLQRGKRLAALGEMAAGIAHEVRNPLGAIGLFAELVSADLEMVAAGGGAAPLREARGNASKITGAVRSLSAVVNDVLSFANQVEPRTVEVSAENLLRSAAEAAGPELDAVEVAFDAAGVKLWVDPDLVHRALLNLIRNAAEAMTAPGAPTLRRLSLSAEPGRIRVADTGPGIEPEAIDRLFNPFFTTRSSGTGLGLAIVHRLIDAHGGAVSVHNPPQGGAVFTLTFPES